MLSLTTQTTSAESTHSSIGVTVLTHIYIYISIYLTTLYLNPLIQINTHTYIYISNYTVSQSTHSNTPNKHRLYIRSTYVYPQRIHLDIYNDYTSIAKLHTCKENIAFRVLLIFWYSEYLTPYYRLQPMYLYQHTTLQ